MGTGTAGACPRDASVPAESWAGTVPSGTVPDASIFTFGLRSDACSLTTGCDHAGMRAWLLPAAACALLVAIGSAGAADRVVERGIVQSIDPAAVVVRALDGSDVSVRLVPATRFRLNGRPANVTDIRPGFVAEVVAAGSGPALVVRAFGDVERPAVRGTLARIGPRALFLRRPSGVTTRIRFGARTTVWRGGRRVDVLVLRPGMRVEVHRAPGGVARVIAIRS